MTTIDVEGIRYILEAPYSYYNRSEECRDRYIRAEDAVLKTTASLTGMPSGGSKDYNEKYVRLLQAEEDWRSALTAMSEARKAVRAFILESPLDEDEQEIIFKRYMQRFTWPGVIGQVNKRRVTDGLEEITERTVYRWHTVALEKLADYFNTEYDQSKMSSVLEELVL